MVRAALSFACALCAMGCGDDDAPPTDAGARFDAGFDAGTPDAGPPTCPVFDEPASQGTVENAAVIEASGLVASRLRDDVLWTHNDSGGAAALYAIGTDGAALGTFSVDGATAQDWEDIAAGPGYLYIGDVGDNSEARANVVIYRVAEPDVDPAAPADGTATAERMAVTYEDGAHNVEALLFDPESDELFAVHKNGSDTATLYRIGPFVADGTVTATTAGMVSTPIATGGDVSPDGREIAIRSYVGIRLWLRPAGTAFADALAGTPCDVPAPTEPQGESVAFARDARGLYTLGEGASQPIWLVGRR